MPAAHADGSPLRRSPRCAARRELRRRSPRCAAPEDSAAQSLSLRASVRIRAAVRRQSRLPSRTARSAPGLPNCSSDPQTLGYTACAPSSRAVEVIGDPSDPPRCTRGSRWRDSRRGRDHIPPGARPSLPYPDGPPQSRHSPGRRSAEPSDAMPTSARSAFPRVSPRCSRIVSASASPWHGWRRDDSRLITGLSQYVRKVSDRGCLPARPTSQCPWETLAPRAHRHSGRGPVPPR